MWKTIYIAATESQAEGIRKMLSENGFLIKLKTTGGKHNKAYEICVPVSEAEDAYEVLCEHKFHG